MLGLHSCWMPAWTQCEPVWSCQAGPLQWDAGIRDHACGWGFASTLKIHGHCQKGSSQQSEQSHGSFSILSVFSCPTVAILLPLGRSLCSGIPSSTSIHELCTSVWLVLMLRWHVCCTCCTAFQACPSCTCHLLGLGVEQCMGDMYVTNQAYILPCLQIR